MGITAPLEVAIACAGMEAMQRFYEDGLGLAHVSTIDVPAEMAAKAGFSDGGYRVTRLETPNGERIKLFQPQNPPAPVSRPPLPLDRCGLAFLTLIVDELESVLERACACGGVRPAGSAPVELRPGVTVAFVADPEGNAVELVRLGDAAVKPAAEAADEANG